MAVIDATWPNPKYDPKYEGEGSLDPLDALRAVLLFHSASPWEQQQAEWLRITGSREATTKVLCDHIRAVLAEAIPPPSPQPDPEQGG